MQELRDGVRTGSLVSMRGHHWLVLQAQPFDDCTLVLLEGRGPHNLSRRLTLLTPFDVVTTAGAERVRRRRRDATLRSALAACARVQPGAGIWSATDGAFEVLDWQLEPMLAVLRGATRLLLADAVGLGKTVQAGLVLAELRRRRLVDRALVLVPAGLRETWATELRDRFQLEAAVLDQTALLVAAREGAAGANPWTNAPVVVSSIDLVKRPEVRAAVEDCPLDLLIVDEAHHAAPGTDRGVLVARLARRVPWLVLASATPHAGVAGDFRFLLDLGRTVAADAPMVVFRRTHQDAGLTTRRRSHRLGVAPNGAERRLHEALLAYARAISSGPRRDEPGIQLLAGVLARRAASSAHAAGRTLQRRLDALAGAYLPPAEAQPPLPWDEHDAADDEVGIWLAAPGLPDLAEERRRLTALVALARDAAAHPSKLLRLQRLLARANEPAVVFTEFRDTLHICLPYLERVGTTVCLHGGMDVAERGRALRAFLGGEAHVLLATDVAGEGLNLHTRARLIVTLEWPWSPARLEQRIGRVDRLGQTRRVHAVHFTARGTVEDTVVARLLWRAARAEHDLGAPGGVTERTVAALVLGAPGSGGTPPHGWAPTPPPALAKAGEARRLRDQRQWALRAGPPLPIPAWCPPRRGRPAMRVAVVLEVTCRAQAGRLDWTTIVPLEVQLARSPAHTRAWRNMCEALARDRRIQQTACAHAEATSTAADFAPVVSRLHSIRQALRAQTPAAVVQPSLFDRRAVRAAEARDAVLGRLEAHLLRTCRVLAGGDGRHVESRVVAIIPLRPADAR